MVAIGRLEGVIDVGPVVSGGTEAERGAAFERFSQDRLERAYHLASVILRDGTDAEDAVHDAAVQAWLHWADLRDRDRLDAWFDRIVVNECRARLRRRTIRPIPMVPSDPPGVDPLTGVLDEDVLNRALAALDAEHRIAVVLRYVAELTPTEIAARTGTREGTVKSRLHYALRRMRAALEDAERASAEGSR
jgi:RNA polymerase sigma-70 factor (ECF subfamily)